MAGAVGQAAGPRQAGRQCVAAGRSRLNRQSAEYATNGGRQ